MKNGEQGIDERVRPKHRGGPDNEATGKIGKGEAKELDIEHKEDVVSVTKFYL